MTKDNEMPDLIWANHYESSMGHGEWDDYQPFNPNIATPYIRKDIVPQDQVMKVLSGLDGLMGATFWNTNDAKHEWAEWANKNRDILRALLAAHVGEQQ